MAVISKLGRMMEERGTGTIELAARVGITRSTSLPHQDGQGEVDPVLDAERALPRTRMRARGHLGDTLPTRNRVDHVGSRICPAPLHRPHRTRKCPHGPHRRHTRLRALQRAGSRRPAGHPARARGRPARVRLSLGAAHMACSIWTVDPGQAAHAHGVPQPLRLVELDRRACGRRARPGTRGALRARGGDRRGRRSARAVRDRAASSRSMVLTVDGHEKRGRYGARTSI